MAGILGWQETWEGSLEQSSGFVGGRDGGGELGGDAESRE